MILLGSLIFRSTLLINVCFSFFYLLLLKHFDHVFDGGACKVLYKLALLLLINSAHFSFNYNRYFYGD